MTKVRNLARGAEHQAECRDRDVIRIDSGFAVTVIDIGLPSQLRIGLQLFRSPTLQTRS
jgi:hypothetical protein